MEFEYQKKLEQLLQLVGLQPEHTHGVSVLLMLISSLLVALIAYLLIRNSVVRLMNLLIKKSSASWDDVFMKHRVLERLAMLVPLLVLDMLLPITFTNYPFISDFMARLTNVATVVLMVLACYAALDAVNDIAEEREGSRRLPVKSILQLIKLFLFFIGLIVGISVLFNQSPVYFLSGLGVATGLVMLVFKDTILGFVAGIQLAANRMISKGDWIQMDKYGANGSVAEISLTTVKVRNWDNTLTMIPAYALVSDSFRNWQGMSDSGGRRIMRSINIDVNSIHFLTDDDRERLERINLLKRYLPQKETEVASANVGVEDMDVMVNGRRLTNIGTFRAYLTEYLRHNDKVHKGMTLMVRQLAPTAEGLPLELYLFTNDTRWVYYEGIQSDIFDHIFAILPEFGLRAFQNPSGEDIRSMKSTFGANFVPPVEPQG